MTVRETIQLFIQDFLTTSDLHFEMKQIILNLLHNEGKIFCENSQFT